MAACPECGYELTDYRCLRCGCSVKFLQLLPEEEEQEKARGENGGEGRQNDYIEIDPNNIYFGGGRQGFGGGSIFDEIFGGGGGSFDSTGCFFTCGGFILTGGGFAGCVGFKL